MNKALAFKIQSSNDPNKGNVNNINQKERNRRSLGIPNRNVCYSLVSNNDKCYLKNLLEYNKYNSNPFDLNEWEEKLIKKNIKNFEYFSDKSALNKFKYNIQYEEYKNRNVIQNSKFYKMIEMLNKMQDNFKIMNHFRSERSVKANHDIKMPKNIHRIRTCNATSRLDYSTLIDKNEVKRIFKLDEFKKPLKLDLFLDNIRLKRLNTNSKEEKYKDKSRSASIIRVFQFQNETINTSSKSQLNINKIQLSFDHLRTTGTIARRINFIK